jgi:outer membrane protein TolC
MKSSLFLLVFLSSNVHAAQTLSWMACVDMAAKNNSELQSSRQKFASTADLEGVARSGFLPSISGSLNYDRGNATTTTNSALTNGTTASTNRYSATLSGTENIFNGMQDLGKVRQADANSASAKAALDTVKAKISFDLKSAYQGVMYAKEYEQFTADIIKRRETNLNMVNMLSKAAMKTKVRSYCPRRILSKPAMNSCNRATRSMSPSLSSRKP